MYIALIDFSDPEDGGVYRKGRVYPRDGVNPTKEHIAYLMGCKNKLSRPVIALSSVVAERQKKKKE